MSDFIIILGAMHSYHASLRTLVASVNAYLIRPDDQAKALLAMAMDTAQGWLSDAGNVDLIPLDDAT